MCAVVFVHLVEVNTLHFELRLCSFAGTFIYVYVGHALHSLVDLLSGDPKAITLEYQAIYLVQPLQFDSIDLFIQFR